LLLRIVLQSINRVANMLFKFYLGLHEMPFRKAIILSMALSANLFAANPQTTHQPIKFPLSNKAYQILNTKTHSLHHRALVTASNLPAEKQLGMSNVPVLDQEDSPFEAVFASTAAIDAALNRGDHISQLCLIKLSNYMSPIPDQGVILQQALSRLENYGFVMKRRQKDAKCEELPFINYENYHQYSKDLSNNGIVWSPILDLNKALYERTNTEKTLAEIQHVLNQDRRATVSFLTVQTASEDHGTTGSYRAKNDTWLLSAKIERDLYNHVEFFFHSMIITGYDNNAITVDDEGQKHKGLLTLRSSWGNEAGDHGDFYMSYDYFRVLVIEAQQIILLQSSD
jgi:hypothetical protein